jgi:hypothetical protein
MDPKKRTTGLNDRPKDASISQTAEGIPDDSGQLVDVDEAEVEKVRKKLTDKQDKQEPEGRPS